MVTHPTGDEIDSNIYFLSIYKQIDSMLLEDMYAYYLLKH